MKISKLVIELQVLLEEVGDLDVYLAKDQEGNGFEPAFCAELSRIRLDDEVYPLHPQDLAAGEYDDCPLGDAVFIWP